MKKEKEEGSWPQRDMLKVDPKLLKSKTFRALADLDEAQPSAQSRKAYGQVNKRYQRVSKFLRGLGSEPSKEPELTDWMLRASEEELTSLEGRLLKANPRSR